MTCILGVDPGLSGALAFIFADQPQRVSVHDMPVVAGGVDPTNLARLVETFNPTHAVVELVGAMPKQGVSSTFKFGEGCGVVRGVLGALRIPVTYVAPGKWKRSVGLSADKEDARGRALQLFPTSAEHFARKKDHGRAEAALIARWFLDQA